MAAWFVLAVWNGSMVPAVGMTWSAHVPLVSVQPQAAGWLALHRTACYPPPLTQVYCFMGHGGRSSSTGGVGGMTSKQQQAVMADFRQPGRRLLVSTSAGEEGIDVPRCEFVVRYTATQTGAHGLRGSAANGWSPTVHRS